MIGNPERRKPVSSQRAPSGRSEGTERDRRSAELQPALLGERAREIAERRVGRSGRAGPRVRADPAPREFAESAEYAIALLPPRPPVKRDRRGFMASELISRKTGEFFV